MKKIISVVGTRPNFMKIAPIHRVFQKYNPAIKHLICHTGQHYDEKMSKIFFYDLELPKPDFNLGIGSGTHAEQTGSIMIEFEKILLKEKPDLIIVVGDVNSTIACSLTASKLSIPVAHVEAGLRSFDREMPEEINRILTDSISDYLFVTEKSGLTNLRNEGIPENKIFFVGNTMIDSLIHLISKTDASEILKTLCVEKKKFVLVTIHRPSNVDSFESLSNIVDLLNEISLICNIIFPIHPRTKKNLEKYNLLPTVKPNIMLTEPIGYPDFINLMKNSALVITDSGGIQEESTYLGIQCITIRKSTERPSTVEIGTNHLTGADFKKVKTSAKEILSGKLKKGKIPEKWDGKTSERICKIIASKLL